MGIYFTKISRPICPNEFIYMEYKYCRQCVNEKNITLSDYLNCKNGIPPEYIDEYLNDEVARQIALIGIYVSISIFILNVIVNIKYRYCNFEKPENENEPENEKSESSISCV